MTTPTTPPPAAPEASPAVATAVAGRPPATPGAFVALYRLVLRHQMTRGRLVLFAALAAISVLLGFVLTRSDARVEETTNVISAFGLGLVVPVVSLVLGSAAIGNWLDDETLVYVWLRPVRRSLIALAATCAALTVTLPVVLISMALIAVIGSGSDAGVLIGALVGSGVAAVAYTSIFVFFGSLIKRSLLWGLVYVFIWEFFVARASSGAAQLSISSYAGSLLAHYSEIDIRLADRALWTSFFVPLAVAAVAAALTTLRLNRANVA